MTGLSEDVDVYDLLEPTNPIRLSWTHYSILMHENNTEARTWYENESVNEELFIDDAFIMKNHHAFLIRRSDYRQVED